MTKTNWVIKNADKKNFTTVAREVANAEGISFNLTSSDLLNMGKPGVYMFLNTTTDKFDHVGRTTESFSRRVNENVSDYPRFASFMKNIKKELGTTNTRKAVDYIVANYKVVILPLDIRRTYNHKKKVDKTVLGDLQKNLIVKFLPKFNKAHNPMYLKRGQVV